MKETRGKVWKPPEQPAVDTAESFADSHVTTEWDEILNAASEAEIVELAAILGFTGLVNQVQFHAAAKAAEGKGEAAAAANADAASFGGWNAAAKSEPLKFVPPEPDNTTDVEESITKLQADDPQLTTLNLNNIKVQQTKSTLLLINKTIYNQILVIQNR